MNSWWMKYLPGMMREMLDGRQFMQRAIGNTGWLLGERLVRMVMGMVVGAWVARYLGPSQFGELAYVISFIAFFQVAANLQGDGFIVRDIIQVEEESSVILGTAFWLRLIFGVFAWIAATLMMYILHPADKQLLQLCAIVGGSMIFQSADTIDLWFQSQTQSRRTVIAKLSAFLFSNCLKVALLLYKAPLLAFAVVMCVEASASAVGLAVAYRRFPTGTSWKISGLQARKLLHLCWPFIASGLMITTFMRVDQIMLKEMMGEHELGIFAAALPISQTWAVIPGTLLTSLAPYVARKREEDENAYHEVLVKIFRSFAILAVAVASLTAIASPFIIRTLYGPQYGTSSLVLSVHVFVNVLVFQGIAQELWVINNNVRMATMVSTFLSAVIGITANALLIRKFGIMGAVYAIFIAQGASVIVVPCILRKDLFELYKRAFLFVKPKVSQHPAINTKPL